MLKSGSLAGCISRPCILSSLFAVALLAVPPAAARYRIPEVEDVPVDRLVRNLEAELAELDRNQGHYARMMDIRRMLARVHAIAYASAAESLNVRPGTNNLYEYPGRGGILQSLGEPGPITVEGERHLRRAIEMYEEAVNYDRYDVRTRLGFAWVLEQAGQSEAALEHYRIVADSAWPVELEYYFSAADDNPMFLFAGSLTIFQEAATAALRYLDPDEDAATVESLESRLASYESLGRAVTPILVPLDSGSPFDTLVDPDAGVEFDLDGSGLARRWGWITPQAAWLVWDPRDRGEIEFGLQLFGSVGFFVFWDNGYEALGALDDDGDGRLAGTELVGLALWHDANGNGISDAGEVQPVTEHGVSAIATNSDVHKQGFPYNPVGVEMSDGSVRASYDWIVQSKPDT